MSVVSKAGERIQQEFQLTDNPLAVNYSMVEGGPPPTVVAGEPLHFEYIDDFGVLCFSRKDQNGPSKR